MKGRHQMAWQEGRRPLAGPFAVCPGRLLTFPPGNATTRQFRSAPALLSAVLEFQSITSGVLREKEGRRRELPVYGDV